MLDLILGTIVLASIAVEVGRNNMGKTYKKLGRDTMEQTDFKYWRDLSEEEKSSIRNSNKFSCGVARLAKVLIDITYPNEKRYQKYDAILEEVACGKNPSMAKLRKRVPEFYINKISAQNI